LSASPPQARAGDSRGLSYRCRRLCLRASTALVRARLEVYEFGAAPRGLRVEEAAGGRAGSPLHPSASHLCTWSSPVSANANAGLRLRSTCRRSRRRVPTRRRWFDGSRLLQDRKSTRLNSSHVKISYAV